MKLKPYAEGRPDKFSFGDLGLPDRDGIISLGKGHETPYRFLLLRQGQNPFAPRPKRSQGKRQPGRSSPLLLLSLALAWLFGSYHGLLPAAHAQTSVANQAKALLDVSDYGGKQLKPSSGQVAFSPNQPPNKPGFSVNIQPGIEEYPGIGIKPPTTAWDLSHYGHVEASIVNTGKQPLTLALRIDNAGDWHDSPWDTESVSLQPGETGTVTTIFGYSNGYKPGFALKPAAVVNILLFTTKSDQEQSFRIESVTAGGSAGETPPVAPEDIRIKPKNGFLMGPGIVIDPARQITSQSANATVVSVASAPSLQIVFPAAQGSDNPSISYKPAVGRWDLRNGFQVQVKIHNTGAVPVQPQVRLDTNGGSSDWTSASDPLVPGAVQTLTIPFAPATPVDFSKPDSASHITSDAVAAVTISVPSAASDRVLCIESIMAGPRPGGPPVWLGKKPPVPGTWVKTLDDEFNGAAINTSVWNIAGANYYDKLSHWSKANDIIGGGVIRLRYDKKTGYQNDDPTQAQTPYASGFLDTYGKWAQCYGYFEARMKLPKAPGLWPAFWMMPDRGPWAGPEQWKQADTHNGGMEFDIMEHLTRWGPHRYNIAMHYDGYDKDQKQIGSDRIYVQPDADGYVTCGLLWIPGSATYYCNGREVAHWDNPRIASVPANLIFTLPMGGWDNNALDDKQLPSDFIVDYVRVWQRKDLASAADGTPPHAQSHDK